MNHPMLAGDDVHVWLAALDGPDADGGRLIGTLSADERGWAARYALPRDQERFSRRRGILRALLGRYLDVKPSGLEFTYSQNGKPHLSGAQAKKGICFNLSHSQGLALFAISCQRRVGIDIERMRPIPGQSIIAESFFSAKEKTCFRALPTDRKNEAFLHVWTKKEAYLKARGDGLGRPLSCGRGETWTVRRILPNPGFVAALAVEGRGWTVSFYQWALGGLRPRQKASV